MARCGSIIPLIACDPAQPKAGTPVTPATLAARIDASIAGAKERDARAKRISASVTAASVAYRATIAISAISAPSTKNAREIA
jgi:hypothetical protein